jgi:hypothetical protein
VLPGDGPAAAYLRLRDAEATYRDSDEWENVYLQMRAQTAAALGLHAEALATWDAARGGGPDSVGTLPAGTRAVDAVAFLAAAADTVRVVMVNEAHHDAAGRLLTLRLLPALYAKGFRYFAAETFSPDSALAAQPAYPTPETGVYLGEPVFGEIVREALRLGYTLVPYEIEEAEEAAGDPALSRQQLRDSMQARHLADRTLGRDPEARVLVHAGFGHVYEEASERWHPMAVYFREITGVDPLTVDQVEMSERSAPAFESPRYRAALAASLVGGAPVVLTDASGQALAGGSAPVDVQVVRPRTRYADGRPAWMAMGGTREAHRVTLPDACAATVCVVEVRRPREPGSTPLDRVVADGAAEAVAFVPSDGLWEIAVRDGRSGDTLLLQTTATR